MVFEYLDQDLRKYLDREQILEIPAIKVLIYDYYHCSLSCTKCYWVFVNVIIIVFFIGKYFSILFYLVISNHRTY